MNKIASRLRRAKKTRLHIKELQVPRLTVTRSNHHISVQLFVDGNDGSTVVAYASSAEKDFTLENTKLSKTDKAKLVGQKVAERALSAGVTKAAFDRSGYKYHGRVKALADGARDGGMNF